MMHDGMEPGTIEDEIMQLKTELQDPTNALGFTIRVLHDLVDIFEDETDYPRILAEVRSSSLIRVEEVNTNLKATELVLLFDHHGVERTLVVHEEEYLVVYSYGTQSDWEQDVFWLDEHPALRHPALDNNGDLADLADPLKEK